MRDHRGPGRSRRLISLLGLGLLGAWGTFAGAADDPAPATPSIGDAVPPAFAPFRHLIGSWKGVGIPEADRLRGWPETHAWAWKFANGTPVGMSVTFTGNKTIASGQLGFDADTKRYRLEGKAPDGTPIAFHGSLGDEDRTLTLNRVGEVPGGDQQLILRLNSNRIRYILTLEVQEPGAPRFEKVITTGVTKVGESFAAKGSAANLPECVITGGAATLSVSYNGKTYPLCCSGCLEEFKASPEKYVKRAALRAEAKGSSPAAPRRRRSSDGAFEGLLGDEENSSRPANPAMTRDTSKVDGPSSKDAKPSGPPSAGSGDPPLSPPSTEPSDDGEPKAPSGEPKAPSGDPEAESRAQTYLRLGQALESQRKTDAALDYYRRVLKDFPGTNASKVAADRMKALGGSP